MVEYKERKWLGFWTIGVVHVLRALRRPLFVKADTCRWVYQNFRCTAKEISFKMSCADPETFVWRAGYYWPYSGFANEMAFRWPADCGPTLNADFVALRVLVGSKPVLLRNPIVL